MGCRFRMASLSMLVCWVVLPAPAQYSLAPGTYTFTLDTSLYPAWNGRLHIDTVTFSPGRFASLDNVFVTDALGRPWFTADNISLYWDPNSAVPAQVSVRRPGIFVYIEANRISPPFTWESTGPSGPPNISPFKFLSVDDASVTVLADNMVITWQAIDITALTTSDGVLKFDITGSMPDKSNFGTIHGSCDLARGEIVYSALLNHFVDANESGIFMSAYSLPIVTSYTGRVAVNVSGDVCIGDPNTYWPAGTVHYTDSTIATDYGKLVGNMDGLVRISRNQLLFENVRGYGMDGSIRGNAFISFPPERDRVTGGRFTAKHIDLAKFSAALNKSWFRQGHGSIVYDFTFRDGDLQSLRADSIVFLDGADVWNVPVFSQIFEYLHLHPSPALTFTDALAEFRMNGQVVTFKSVRITSPVSAIIFEPNLTANLENHYVDAYAVAVVFKDIRTILSRLPALDIISKFNDRFLRLHIQGYWDQPGTEIVKLNLLKNIQTGTGQFVKDAASSGGHISSKFFEAFGAQPAR
jgi:hypothetical protein